MNLSPSKVDTEPDKPQEACGITGIFSKKGKIVTPLLVSMQDSLQHRGRDAAGIATLDRGTRKINVYKHLGKVKKVFPDNFNFGKHGLLSHVGIGHNRYGTSGDDDKDSILGSQPVEAYWNGRSIAIAYNGNLPESERMKLRGNIPEELNRGLNFDTLDIANAIVSSDGRNWEERIKNALKGVYLAYSLTILTDEGELFGLACPSETWPLWAGETDDTIIFASETRVYKGLIDWQRVRGGQLVKATQKGIEFVQLFPRATNFRCALHDQYGARGDSMMTEDITYRDFREHLGQLLAREHPIEADIYTGIPRNSISIAEGYVKELGRELTEVFTLINKDRSFIARNNDEINAVISGKYAILHPEKLTGKKVLLIDDSLIRGKTAAGDCLKGVKGVINLIRDARASEVHFAVTLPKFTKDCDMGYFIRKDHLIALAKREDGQYEELSEQQIARRIGADGVYYLSMEGVKDAYEWAVGVREVACFHCVGGVHPLLLLAGRTNGVSRQEKEQEKTAVLTDFAGLVQ